MSASHLAAQDVNLPIRPFLYTLDQIATLVGYNSVIELTSKNHLFFMGRQTGRPAPNEMAARDIAQPGEKPEWRVAEHELVRWLKSRGFKVREPRWLYQ